MKKENIEKAKEFVIKLENILDESTIEELSNVAGTIAKNMPFDKKHITPIKKLEKKKHLIKAMRF